MKGRRGLTQMLPAAELSLFCTEMGILLQSGMSIFDGIAAHITAQSGRLPKKGDRPHTVFEQLYLSILDGHSLSQSMQQCGVFPAGFISMIRIGEESGSLDEIMNSMAVHYRRDNSVSNEIRSALTYPILTLCMMAIILQILTRQVFPVFTDIYESLGSGLPGSAAASISIGSSCAGVLTILSAVLVIGALVIWVLGRFPTGQRLLNLGKSHLPFIARISRQLASARLADSLAMLMEAGYDVQESLIRIGQAMADPFIQRQIDQCCQMLQQGREDGSPIPLADALCSLGVWNDTECQMIRSGVRFGSLDSVLRQIAQDGMDKAEERVSRAVSLIEPIMIAITAVLIGSILLSVMLPLSGIMAAIG